MYFFPSAIHKIVVASKIPNIIDLRFLFKMRILNEIRLFCHNLQLFSQVFLNKISFYRIFKKIYINFRIFPYIFLILKIISVIFLFFIRLCSRFYLFYCHFSFEKAKIPFQCFSSLMEFSFSADNGPLFISN